MGFGVNTAALAGLPVLLDRRARELDTASRYLPRHAHVLAGHSSGALHPLHAAHERLVDAVTTALIHRAETLGSQADAVRAAIARYAAADSSSAAALDRALPLPAHHGALPHTVYPGAGPQAFESDWVSSPQLHFPPDFRTEQPVEFAAGSPVRALGAPRDMLRWLHAQHPMFDGLADAEAEGWSAAGELLAGDWPGGYASAYCFESLGAALAAVDTSLTGAAEVLGTVWTGHAAAACTGSLVADAGTLHRIGLAVIRLVPPYQQAASAARGVEVGVGSLLLALADAALQPIDLVFGAPLLHQLFGVVHSYDAARQAADRAVAATDAAVALLHAEQ